MTITDLQRITGCSINLKSWSLPNTSGKEKPVKFLIFWKWMQG